MHLTSALPDNFAGALRFLRKRARLTQDELGRAVGYSREQIARLENGSRLPDLAVIAALFVPALLLERDRQLVEQFLTLAGQTRTDQQVTVTHTRQTRVQLVSETVVAPAAPAHTPPAPLLPLIGRGAEVADLLALLPTNRLITLVGAPGIGKSRLALELAHQALSRFADGVVFVPLADVTLASDIPYAVLTALSVTPSAQQTAESAIRAYLAPRQLLLVMDNCEHILEGVALFADWLAQAPGLKLLCTSRVPLDLYGEQEWPVAPLAVPDLAQPPDIVQWGALPAMQLLLARGRAVDPAFRLTAENILPLATLCAALDGLPLALELAAVRLRELPPDLLTQQLLLLRGNGRLSSTWLQQNKRNIAERHRTLQAAIEWSVRLLPPPQQAAFFHLGVFVGGCTEAAAQAVALADASLLSSLARANLVQYENGRIALLETLRAFAQEQLTASNQLLPGQRAHARHYAAYAQQIFTGLLGDEQATWMRRALADHENCLTALRWAVAQEDGETAVAIAGGLWWFWWRRGLFKLGREMLQAALQLATPDLPARANALNGLASIYLVLEEYAANLACHQEGLALRRQLNDAPGIATVLHNMGLAAYTMGEYAQALGWFKESIAANPQSDPTHAWAHMGLTAQELQDLPQARHWLEQAYERVTGVAEGWLQAFVMNFLADVLRELGELDRATDLAQESLRMFIELEDSFYQPDPQLTLAQIAYDQGAYETAVALAAVVYTQYEARDDPAAMAGVLLLQAQLAWKMGQTDAAVDLLTRARALRQTVKRAISPREQASYEAIAREFGVLLVGEG